MENRIPTYLSPSALHTFEYDQDTYVERYRHRSKREPQTEPMAAGSAFDAYCKAYLHERFVGNGDPAFGLQALFEAQVEPQCRDYAWKLGKYLFDEYRKQGALNELCTELAGAATEPLFEDTVTGTVGGVPLLGKPDVFFTNAQGVRVIYDWKVNGAFSKASPIPGFRSCEGKPHKTFYAKDVGGIKVDQTPFELRSSKWADQLATYAWLVGEDVGSEEWIVGIDQLACNKKYPDLFPLVRVAVHRGIVSRAYQEQLLERYKACWEFAQNMPDRSDILISRMNMEEVLEGRGIVPNPKS